uniref:Uncharacterized protein n=1 Tax=Arundo donax TaxID=35708 RepID=A0A0A9DGN0_ARUDO
MASSSDCHERSRSCDSRRSSRSRVSSADESSASCASEWRTCADATAACALASSASCMARRLESSEEWSCSLAFLSSSCSCDSWDSSSDTFVGGLLFSLSALMAMRRSTLGLSPVGDSAVLAVRPVLLLPCEDVRVGCSKEPFLELLLLEYNLRKCILFKDSMTTTTGERFQRLSSFQTKAKKKKKGFSFGGLKPNRAKPIQSSEEKPQSD